MSSIIKPSNGNFTNMQYYPQFRKEIQQWQKTNILAQTTAIQLQKK